MEPVICKYCEQPVKRVIAIYTKVDIWQWDGKGYNGETGADLSEPLSRAGLEPEYTSTIYLCPNCLLSISEGEVNKRIYFPSLGKNPDKKEG